LKKWMLQWIE